LLLLDLRDLPRPRKPQRRSRCISRYVGRIQEALAISGGGRVNTVLQNPRPLVVSIT
jgi:hypothetical protein